MEGNLTIPIKITHVILFDTISKLLESPPMDALTCVKIRCVCVYVWQVCVCVYMYAGVAYYIHLHYYSQQ